MAKHPATGEDEIMDKVRDLINEEVGVMRKDLDNHIDKDHDYFKVLTDAVAEIKEGNKESRKAQKEIMEMTLAVKDLAVSIRDETKDKIHGLEKKVMEVNHKNDIQDVKFNSKPKNPAWFRLVDTFKQPLTWLISGLVVLVLYLLGNAFGIDLSPLTKIAG